MEKTYPTRAERLKKVTDRLEAGVTELFEGDRFVEYLRTASKFHRYSFRNILLIAMQHPAASQVAGYNDWKKKFGRQVKKGEKGIQILAPCSFGASLVQQKVDPDTGQPMVDNNGQPVEKRTPILPNRFRVVTVFDISQTEGPELPEVVSELTGTVERYDEITKALEVLSPVPISFEDIPGTAKGCFDRTEGRITVRPGMSQAQTLKTMIHEVAHAKLHSGPTMSDPLPGETKKDRHTREVEAESVAYVVCQHFGVDTSDYSFGYVAGWSKGKDLTELKSSLDCIRGTAAKLIDGIEGNSREQPPPKREQAAPSRAKPRRGHTRTTKTNLNLR